MGLQRDTLLSQWLLIILQNGCMIINFGKYQIISFIEHHIICMFGIAKTLTIDQWTVFTGENLMDIAQKFGMKMIRSSPLNAHANGQAKTTKSIIIDIIKSSI